MPVTQGEAWCRRGPCAGQRPGRQGLAGPVNAETAVNVETPHPVETSHAWRVFCVRRTKNFHVVAARGAAAPRRPRGPGMRPGIGGGPATAAPESGYAPPRTAWICVVCATMRSPELN